VPDTVSIDTVAEYRATVTAPSAARVAAVHRHGPPVSDVEREAATGPLVDLLAAAETP
jgi:hypothetical protein